MLCRDGKGIRCKHDAEWLLVDPDGKTQGRMCLRHVHECCQEYRDKLGELWQIRPIERWES